MQRGYIDAITSAGMVEGWAYDERKPLEPLLVAVTDDKNKQFAAGLANLYRRDLAEANHGYGWCYFRLCAKQNINRLAQAPLRLIALESKLTLHALDRASYFEANSHVVNDVSDLIGSDPTVINSLDQLDSFEDIFENFILVRGVDAFVRAAYVYVLGRSIDDSGMLLYGRLIRQKRLSPYAMLRTLADSAEFRAKARSLVAPNQPGFPFRLGYS